MQRMHTVYRYYKNILSFFFYQLYVAAGAVLLSSLTRPELETALTPIQKRG
jgi:hypothetical protein